MLFGDALDAAPFPCVRLDHRGAMTSANPAASDLLGLQLHRRTTSVLSAFVAPGHTSTFFLFLRRLLRSGKIQQCTLPLRAADGRQHIVQLDGRREETEDETKTILLSLTNVSERETAAAQLQASEERMRTLLESLPDAVFVVRDGEVVDCNPAAFTIAGAHPLGRPFADLVTPEQRSLVAARKRRPQSGNPAALERHELRFLGEAQEERAVETLWLPIEFQGEASELCVARDRTAQRRLEAQIANNDRLATVGVLAAGVAHELNNPLTYVTMSISELASTLADPALDLADIEALQQTATDALDGARRMARIVSDMQGLTRFEAELGPVDANAVIERALALCKGQIRARVEVVTNLGLVPPAYGDEGRLTQIVLNLLLNAVQALPEEGGRVTVTTSTTVDGIALVVEDSGPGIPAAIVDRLFEPFVTTKPVGEGTGLGLFVCHTYVGECGGTIRVRNAESGGAEFTVELRAAATSGTPRETELLPEREAPRLRRVLIVDDEPLIREAVSRRFGCLGEVETCSSAEAALSRLREGHNYDLILCDLMMPGSGGRALHSTVATDFPEHLRRLAIMTGGAVDEEDVQFLRSVDPPCCASRLRVRKPWNLREPSWIGKPRTRGTPIVGEAGPKRPAAGRFDPIKSACQPQRSVNSTHNGNDEPQEAPDCR